MITTTSFWQSLLADAATKLQVNVVSWCMERNEKNSPRYFHADVVATHQPATKWRMKVVNSSRDDRDAVQDCNSYNNSVHARLIKANALRPIVRIPRCFALPPKLRELYNVSEFVDGNAPSAENFELIVDVLVKLQTNRDDVVRQLQVGDSTCPRGLHRFDYRERVKGSLRGLVGCVDSDQILRAFNIRWFTNGIPSEVQTFAHGDFSFGNLRLAGRTLALIDFEHSHIGLGCVDMAHLYVNLFADGQAGAATLLRNHYKTKFLEQQLWFEDDAFEALVIERAAGKMNAMKDRTTGKFETLRRLLLSLS